MDIAARCQKPELMDQPNLSPHVHRQALVGLRRVNTWSRTVPIVWRRIEAIAQTRNLRELSILDIACGGGDFVLGLARQAEKRGYAVRVMGCDVSPTAVASANDRRDRLSIQNASFSVCDVLNDTLPDEYDVITCTLFMHHLSREQAVYLLRRASSAARHAVLVDDLLRTRSGYLLAQLGCRLLTRSPIVHYDGPLSVRCAYTADEFRDIACEAGLGEGTLARHWPQRFLFAWERRP